MPFRILLLLPLQGMMFLPITTLAQPIAEMGCMAKLPACLNASQGSQVNLAGDKAEEQAPTSRFLPEGHTGVTCMALLPECMTRSQWAEVCEGWKKQDSVFQYPKSCREALELEESEPS
jgi:hypothetical protein